MTTARALIVAAFALAAVMAASVAQAIPTDQYLALRREQKCDRQLTYAQVEASPTSYLGKVMELRGTVNGAIRRDSGVAFLLTLPNHRGILLNAPDSDVRMVSDVNDQHVRVLAKVTEGTAGNVVPLEVLGVGYDVEITAREQQAEKEDAAEHARAHVARQPARSSYASRGGYYTRPMFNTGGVSQYAAHYLTPEAQSVFPVYKAYIARCNPRLSNTELDAITQSLLHYAWDHQVDPRLVVALIIAESDFDPRSTSNKGAMGLGQIMPDEAQSHGVTNPYDPSENVRTCVNLLRMKLDLYPDGSPPGQPSQHRVELALAAYNAGAGAVKKYGYNIPPYRETQNYVKKIIRIYHELCSQG